MNKQAMFEVLALGFDASTDATDDRVIWVAAPDADTLHRALAGAPRLAVHPLPVEQCGDEAGLDYTLPEDADKLVERLRAFACSMACTCREAP